jgi:hypothetical protein
MMSKDSSLEWFVQVKMKEGCNVIGGMHDRATLLVVWGKLVSPGGYVL